MQVVLMLRCLISLYMYGAEGIFAKEESMFHSWVKSLNILEFINQIAFFQIYFYRDF